MSISFKDRIEHLGPFGTRLEAVTTLQVNLGNICNQSCLHCHIDASPQRNTKMSLKTINLLLKFLAMHTVPCLDITGGCPELHPDFTYLIEESAHLPLTRILRSNLTVLVEPDRSWLPAFLAKHQVVINASLPCYRKENVDRQRGDGTFQKSISALKLLNDLGYGRQLDLNLVYNPSGSFLPPPQKDLERAYREELQSRYGIVFNNLYTITNAPVGRFKTMLDETNAYDEYLKMLQSHFNPAVFPYVMCRTLLSVDPQGFLYNCDFNQAAGLPLKDQNGTNIGIGDILHTGLATTAIRVGEHCYSCMAGSGSSCNGTLDQ